MSITHLTPNQEFRFLVGDEPIKIKLQEGLAEVYGNEMLQKKEYTFPRHSKAAILTYHGATIEVTGTPSRTHVGKECEYMFEILLIHGELEKMREQDTPPICLVCKQANAYNVGKSALCRILLNYATRRGRVPTFVDLDPDQGPIGLPGTIGALPIQSPIDIEAGLDSGPSMLMHFGHTRPSAASEVYKALLDNMANIVHSKLQKDKRCFQSGIIINTSSWSDEADYELLVYACKAFNANMVLVMDDEISRDELKKDLAQVNVIKVPKLVGIPTVPEAKCMERRYLRIKEYFYGTPNEPYSPMTSEIKFSFLSQLIYTIRNPLILPDSLMPLGTKISQHLVSRHECTASDLLNHILAISNCKISAVVKDPEAVLRTNIMGFICITSVRGDKVSILSPQKLPRKMDHVLLYSNLQYMDSLF